MPSVTLSYQTGTDWTSSGGCFGFTGRNSSVLLRGNNVPITNYQFDLSSSWNNRPLTFNDLDNNPGKLWDFLANNDLSPWKKYVHRLNRGGSAVFSGWSVDIKTDIPGHFVIGTASIFRFVVYMASDEGKQCLVIFNEALRLGSHPMIAFLVATTAYCSDTLLFNHSNGSTSGSLYPFPSLGDDTPLKLNAMDINSLYEMIDGSWEYKESDATPYGLYSTTGRYSQEILNSFIDGDFSFPLYIQNRFFPKTLQISKTGSGGGMGRRQNSYDRLISDRRTIEPMALIGAALQLTSEYKKHGCFAGIRKTGGNVNGV